MESMGNTEWETEEKGMDYMGRENESQTDRQKEENGRER